MTLSTNLLNLLYIREVILSFIPISFGSEDLSRNVVRKSETCMEIAHASTALTQRPKSHYQTWTNPLILAWVSISVQMYRFLFVQRIVLLDCREICESEGRFRRLTHGRLLARRFTEVYHSHGAI